MTTTDATDTAQLGLTDGEGTYIIKTEKGEIRLPEPEATIQAIRALNDGSRNIAVYIDFEAMTVKHDVGFILIFRNLTDMLNYFKWLDNTMAIHPDES